MVRQGDRDSIFVHTIGGHAVTAVDAGPGVLDGLVWAVAQAGEWGVLDHVAWAHAVELGYQLPRIPAQPWLRIGYNGSSGDGDPTDGDHGTFFQVMPTARVYAQLPFFNLMNNQDVFAQLILRPHARVTIRTDYHWLSLTERRDLWYAGGGATNAKIFGFAGAPSGGHRELAHLVDLSADRVAPPVRVAGPVLRTRVRSLRRARELCRCRRRLRIRGADLPLLDALQNDVAPSGDRSPCAARR